VTSIRRIVAGTALLLLAGCDLAPDYTPPVVEVPVTYKEQGPFGPAHPADTLPRGPWWVSYGDAELDTLEDRIDTDNPDLAVALSVYTRARAFAAEAEAADYPTVGLASSLSTNKQSEHRPLRSHGQPTYFGGNTLNVQASYEVDLWGRINDEIVAGEESAQASAADLESVRLSLHTELANDYMQLRGWDARIALFQNTVTAYAQALQLTQNRFAGKIASGLDVSRAEAQLASAKAAIVDAVAARALLEHAIATLVGVPAPEFSVPPPTVPLKLQDIPIGLPSTLLERRPDIASAERQVAAANEGIGVAESAFYPSLSIGAEYGTQSTDLNLLELPNSFWSIGPSAALPLFEGGLRHAELAGAKAAYEGEIANYRQTVLNGFQEVEDNLSLLQSLKQEEADQVAASEAAQRTLAMSLNLYKDGAQNYLEVVVSQTEAFQAERAVIDVRTRQFQASVALIGALGGGWSRDQLPGLETVSNIEE
jgi:NodT family efflux transporter outer membrane factor (OMF) lipoprotein